MKWVNGKTDTFSVFSFWGTAKRFLVRSMVHALNWVNKDSKKQTNISKLLNIKKQVKQYSQIIKGIYYDWCWSIFKSLQAFSKFSPFISNGTLRKGTLLKKKVIVGLMRALGFSLRNQKKCQCLDLEYQSY